jgi:uncharacterized BrkB/YihY/UPF0761 family membrane protein
LRAEANTIEYTRAPRFDAAVTGLTAKLSHAGLSLHSAHRQALARMYGMTMSQSQAMSYVDIYWLLAVMCALMFLLSFVLAKNKPQGNGEVVAH